MIESPWLPWAYQYAVGGALAAATFALALRTGALRLGRRHDRRLAAVLAAGYLCSAAIHALWIGAVR